MTARVFLEAFQTLFRRASRGFSGAVLSGFQGLFSGFVSRASRDFQGAWGEFPGAFLEGLGPQTLQ